jgi:RHS repeat-associated protein
VYAQYPDQSNCASGTVNYSDSGWDGGTSDAEDQTVCLSYDSQTGLDSYVETDNDYAGDFYSEYGYDNMFTYGVGAEAQLVGFDADNNSSVVADSFMNYSGTDWSGAQSAVATIDSIPQQYPAYQLNGSWAECESGNGPSCNWWGASSGLSVELSLAPVLPTPTLSLGTSGTPSAAGQSVTFTALASGTGAVPTGTIIFYDGSASIGSVSLMSATNLLPFSNDFNSWNAIQAQVTPNATTAPDGSNTAALISVGPLYYVGQNGFACSPGPVTHSVWLEQNNANPDAYVWLSVRFFNSQGAELILTGSVFAPTSNWQRVSETYTAPAGTTSCWIGIEQLNTNWGAATSGSVYAWGAQVEQASSVGPYIPTGASAQSDGISTLPTSALLAGTHSITASYSGDANYGGATSNAISQTILPSGSSMSLICFPSTVVVGGTSTCTANLPAGTPGTISFTVDGAAWQTVPIDPSGAAVARDGLGQEPVGTHTVTATFSFGGAQSVAVTINANSAPTTVYSYSITQPNGVTTGYAPNGNVVAYTDSVNGTWSFGYDDVNRLTSSVQTAGGAQQYSCWSYDSFGNRQIQTISDLAFPGGGTQCQPASGANYSTTEAVASPSNQVASGWWQNAYGISVWGTPGYDAAGNMTSDIQNQYLYDAEGRICAVQMQPAIVGLPNPMIQYLYDAEGNRIGKGSITTWSCDASINPNTGLPNNGFSLTNEYVVDPDGNQVSELDGNGNWLHTNAFVGGQLLATYDSLGLHYQVADWLGTRRVQASPAGAIEEICQNLPFGDQANCTQTSAPTADDATEHHFTGDEYDPETGLSHTMFRQMASTMGRWMSPDPYDGSMDLGNPQSFNRYGYGGNRPLNFIDPSGLQFGDTLPIAGSACGPVCVVIIFSIGAALDLLPGLFQGSPELQGTTQPRPCIANCGHLYQPPDDPIPGGSNFFLPPPVPPGGTGPSNPTPCNQSRANGKALDYSQPIHNGLTTMQHIQSRHMPGVGRQNVSTYWTQDWSAVGKMNYWTFVFGDQSFDRGSVVIDFTFPNLRGWLFPGGLQNGIGYDAKGNDTLTNHLVLMPDCKTVVTSYPIE